MSDVACVQSFFITSHLPKKRSMRHTMLQEASCTPHADPKKQNTNQSSGKKQQQKAGSCQLFTQTCDTSMPFKNTYKKQAVHTQKAKLVHGKMVAVLRATTHNTHIPYTMLFLDIFVATVWLFFHMFLMITTKSASINPGPNSFRKVPNLDSPISPRWAW